MVVIPDILAMGSPGERAECRREASQRKSSAVGHDGVRGLRALGVRDLSYRLAFIANSVQVGDTVAYNSSWIMRRVCSCSSCFMLACFFRLLMVEEIPT